MNKLIEINNQELSDPTLIFEGMESVEGVVFVMTNKGLYGFSKWGDFTEPINSERSNEFYWSNIQGTDITYVDDDSLVIPSGQFLNKYYLRHDFVLLDRNNNRIHFREKNPDFDIEEV